MKVSDYKDFKDFCDKNHFTREQGIQTLFKELEKLGFTVSK